MTSPHPAPARPQAVPPPQLGGPEPWVMRRPLPCPASGGSGPCRRVSRSTEGEKRATLWSLVGLGEGRAPLRVFPNDEVA